MGPEVAPRRGLREVISEFTREGNIITQDASWFQINECRERGSLLCVGIDDFCIGGNAVAGEDVNHILAGQCWNRVRRENQLELD